MDMKTSLVLASIVACGGVIATHSYTDNNAETARSKNSMPVGSVYVIIDKSDYELSVYDAKGWYCTYPVVFGNSSLADKKMEGDKNTPEGSFQIASKRVHDKWHRFLSLNYPTQESWAKFNQRKQKGEIPSSARIGGGIGIHGTWPHEDFQIDRYKNWTLGCISMKNEDVEHFYRYVPVGTKITIRR
jgi:lipoprotein-anchoring transpeptidase ErfK/SrfK